MLSPKGRGQPSDLGSSFKWGICSGPSRRDLMLLTPRALCQTGVFFILGWTKGRNPITRAQRTLKEARRRWWNNRCKPKNLKRRIQPGSFFAQYVMLRVKNTLGCAESYRGFARVSEGGKNHKLLSPFSSHVNYRLEDLNHLRVPQPPITSCENTSPPAFKWVLSLASLFPQGWGGGGGGVGWWWSMTTLCLMVRAKDCSSH